MYHSGISWGKQQVKIWLHWKRIHMNRNLSNTHKQDKLVRMIGTNGGVYNLLNNRNLTQEYMVAFAEIDEY